MPKRWIAVAVLAVGLTGLAASLILGGESDEEQIETGAEQVFASGDPDSCELFTDGYYEQVGSASGVGPDGAEEACREAAAPAESATVGDVEIDGETATATVEIALGDEPGQAATQTVSFVDDDGWKVDEVGAAG